MKLLPRGLTKGLSKFTGEFLSGVWDGMGPDIRRKSDKANNSVGGRKRRKTERRD